jgi:hypothetical protein
MLTPTQGDRRRVDYDCDPDDYYHDVERVADWSTPKVDAPDRWDDRSHERGPWPELDPLDDD